MPTPSATAKGRLGLWGVPFPYIDQSPAGKTPASGTTITITPRREDERLVRVPLVSILLGLVVLLWL